MERASELHHAMEGLNPAQRRAVEHVEGPLLVLAGAGSGKTRVITHRIARMIAEGVPAERILAVTFTNKAAREMRGRVADLTGEGRVLVGTFHAFCALLLRQEFPVVGRGSGFTIYDEGDAQVLIKRVVEELGLDPQHHQPQSLRTRISRWKNGLVLPQEALAEVQGTSQEPAARAYVAYDRRLKEANACDFDDLLVQALLLLRDHEEVQQRWRERCTHVLVDEFQDTNRVQYELVHALCRRSRNLCITGDPDQSIYSWRGAEPANFDRFLRDYPEAASVALERNYRSTGHILQAASSLIDHNRMRLPKTLYTDRDEGEPVRVVGFEDDYQEARAIGQVVREWEAEGLSRREVAVFFRTNALSLPVERILLQEGIPYQLVGGLEFFGRTEVKDVLAYLRFLVNPRDGVSLLRVLNVPPRGIGSRTREMLLQTAYTSGRQLGDLLRDPAAFRSLPLRARTALEGFSALLRRLDERIEGRGAADTIEILLDETRYAEWWRDRSQKSGTLDPYQNIGQLLSLAREFEEHGETDLRTFLEKVSLLTDLDRWQDQEEAVSLMTLHSSKGLEFDAVIIIGVESGTLPHAMSSGDPAGLEEERRLLHVGMTRARRRLVLTHARTRMRFGRPAWCTPSMFLDELGVRGVEHFGDSPRGVEEGYEYEDEHHPLAALRPGCRVRHGEWGEGVVTRIRGRGAGLDRKVVVAFDEEGERTLILRHADLEIVDDREWEAL